MKYILLFFSFVVGLLFVPSVFAINSTSEGYRIDMDYGGWDCGWFLCGGAFNSYKKVITAHSSQRRISSYTCSNDSFIGTKASAEWTSFINYHPGCISLTTPTYSVPTSVTLRAKWTCWRTNSDKIGCEAGYTSILNSYDSDSDCSAMPGYHIHYAVCAKTNYSNQSMGGTCLVEGTQTFDSYYFYYKYQRGTVSSAGSCSVGLSNATTCAFGSCGNIWGYDEGERATSTAYD